MAGTSTSSTSSTSTKMEAPPTATKQDVDGGENEYAVPVVELTRDDEVALRTTIRTSDDAQQMFLNDAITEDELAKAVNLFGKPSNPSETVNRADAAYEKKLPKWVFQQPEGSGLTIEERQAEVEATTPSEPAPLTHEQLVTLPPVEQAKAAEEQAKEADSTAS